MLRSLRRITCCSTLCFALALAVAALAPDAGARQRTFVASYGGDGNACTLGAPCRTFATALTHTDADGEIIVLDSAGYGSVTISQSVSIIASPGIYAGISVFAGTNGVDVDGAFMVVLRGLSINGQGGDYGIRYVNANPGKRLYIEQCVISNMLSGIRLEAGNTYVSDSTIRDNTGSGISIIGGTLVVDRSRIERNGSNGLSVSNATAVTVTNSVIAGNATMGCSVSSTDGATLVAATITDSNISQNGVRGIYAFANGAGSIVRLTVARNTIARNSSHGVSLDSSTGELTAIVTDNTLVRNSKGFWAISGGVSATLAANAVFANNTGIEVIDPALVRTRNNNVVQDNTTNISGALVFVGGD